MILLLLLACRPAPPPVEVAEARVPVLLLTLDTTRADRLGCYGHAAARTPHLDALAARGTRFERAYTPAPLTIPAHASVHTGLLPPRHGVRDNGDHRLPSQATTLAEILAWGGYTPHAAVGAFVTQGHWGFDQGFVRYSDDLGVRSDRLSWRAERPADQVVDDALASLEDGADFLWVHLFDPHAPYDPPTDFDQGVPYDGEIAWMDAQVGRLLDALPPEALVVVAGDHGEALGEGGEQQHGLLLVEGSVRVPLIFAGPGVPEGEVVQHPVSLVDIAPTVLRLVDLPVPSGLDGVDLFHEPARVGVYTETRYGHHHFGWTPLVAVTTAQGRLVRGARDEGEVSPRALAWMEEQAQGHPAWEPAPVTLDATQVEQLQALGYLGGPEPVAPGDLDPRDGIALLQRYGQLHDLPATQREPLLRELLSQTPRFHDARVRLARELARSGRLEEALSEVATVYQDRPDSTAAMLQGDLWRQAGRPDEALSWYLEALVHDPRAPRARAGEVEALVALGRVEEAHSVAALALEVDPDDGRLTLARAALALAAGEPVEPWVQPATQVAEARPYEPGSLHLAARLHQATGDPVRAEELYRAELRWRPRNLPARRELVALYQEQGRLVDVVRTARPMLNLSPDDPEWNAVAARAYLDMDREEEARAHAARCRGWEGCP